LDGLPLVPRYKPPQMRALKFRVVIMNEKWNFEERLSRSIKSLVLLILSFVIGFALWFYFYPVVTNSVVFWVGAVLMGCPIYCAGEGLGSFGLNLKLLNSWPKSLRILFGVIWVLVCMTIFIIIIGALVSMLV